MASHENHAAPADDETTQVASAVDELIADYGLRTVIGAILRTEVGDKISSANPEATRRVVQFVLREIVFSTNPQLEAEIMAIGSGILDDNGIMTRVGAKHGITRQAISKRAVAFCEAWKLPPSAGMKSIAARKKYAACNKPRE